MVTVSHDRAFLDEVTAPLSIYCLPLRLSFCLSLSLCLSLCLCLSCLPACLSLSIPLSRAYSPGQVCTDVMHISGVAKRLTQVRHLTHAHSLTHTN